MARRLRRPDVRRAAPVLPTSFTLGNLFFGIFAIVAASRGEYGRAVLYIVFGGACDAIDGRVARATRSGTEFGEQLDSLVDAISFGLAPAMIVYFAVLNRDGWVWVLSFFFTACAVARLARFNVTQAGESKSYFIGMPSPAAGGTLATYYWFSQTDLYKRSVEAQWPWHEMIWYLMIGLGILMVSAVPYPAWPKIGFRSWAGRIGLVIVIAIVAGVTLRPKEFLFLFGVGYAIYGLVRVAILGMWERRAGADVGAAYAEYANEFADEIDDGYADEIDDEPAPPPPPRRRPTGESAAIGAPARRTPAIAAPPIPAAGDDGTGDDDTSVATPSRPKRKRRRRPRGDRPPGTGHESPPDQGE